MIRPAILLLFLHFLGSGCKTVPTSPDIYQGDMITIGEGGGITGIESRYYYTDAGHVFQQSGMDSSFLKLASIDRRIVSQAIHTAMQLDLLDYSYSQPGNVYKFITFKIGGKENKIVWGTTPNEVRPICVDIFALLKKSIK